MLLRTIRKNINFIYVKSVCEKYYEKKIDPVKALREKLQCLVSGINEASVWGVNSAIEIKIDKVFSIEARSLSV